MPDLVSAWWPIIGPVVVLGLLSILGTGAWIIFRGALCALLKQFIQDSIHAPIYARMERQQRAIEKKVAERHAEMKALIEQVQIDAAALRQNGHMFADRVKSLEDRVQQGAEELHDLRREIRAGA
jgi:hypothetical protein